MQAHECFFKVNKEYLVLLSNGDKVIAYSDIARWLILTKRGHLDDVQTGVLFYVQG